MRGVNAGGVDIDDPFLCDGVAVTRARLLTQARHNSADHTS